MKRKNATRNALFTSVLSLLLCVSMLVGTTFAWFTDEVVSGMNTIAAGNLDVELFYSKNLDFSDEKKVDGQTLLFTDKDGNKIEHWEPGVVAYTNLQVANVGTLALTYRMSLNFGNMNTVTYEGAEYDLSDVLQVAIVDGGFTGERDDAHALTNYQPMESFHVEGELEGDSKAETIGVVVYWMPGDNDNIWNINNDKTTSDGEPLRVELGINLFATQEEFENDSFDNTYDEPADNTIAAGETVRLDEDGQKIEENYVNNGTLIIEGGEVDTDSYAVDNRGTAILEDVTVNAGNPGNYALIARGEDAVTTLDQVDLTSGGGAIAAADGATVTVNGGKYVVDSTSTSGRYVIYASGAGSKVIVNDGDFSWSTAKNQKRAYVYAGAGTTVEINGGTFGKASTRSGYTAGILGDGTVIIKGGTFGFDPSKWVAPGYKAEKSGDTWTVGPMATDNAGLNDAIAGGETEIALGAGEYTLPTTTGDVSISGTKDVEITIGKPKAENVALTGVTVIGSGYATGIQHSQKVVFEDCVIKGVQCLYADEVLIKDCTIDLTEVVDYIWTYGAKNVTFDGCTFNTNGKAILIYNEGADLVTNVTVKNCTFNATQSALASGATAAAIEIDSSLSTNGHYTLTTENNKVDEDFSSEWRVKKSGTDNTTVNGVICNAITSG